MSPLHTPTSTYYIAATYPYYSNNSSTDDEHFRLAIFCSARLACQISFHSMFHGALGRETRNEWRQFVVVVWKQNQFCSTHYVHTYTAGFFGCSGRRLTDGHWQTFSSRPAVATILLCSARDNIESKLESVKHNNTHTIVPEVDQISRAPTR